MDLEPQVPMLLTNELSFNHAFLNYDVDSRIDRLEEMVDRQARVNFRSGVLKVI